MGVWRPGWQPSSSGRRRGAAVVSLPRGLYGPDLVDVGYEPWLAVRPTALRLGPSPAAPQVLSDDGEPVGLAGGQHFGRQTTRNPDCLDSPPLRSAVDGFVWGYCMPPATKKSGWIRLSDLTPDPMLAQLACGPAGADFDRRRPDSCGGHCDGRALTDVRADGGTAIVVARDLYLRYAPGSTAFRYLVCGDTVRRLVRARHGAWTGVDTRSAQWTGPGTRGWVLTSALTAPESAERTRPSRRETAPQAKVCFPPRAADHRHGVRACDVWRGCEISPRERVATCV